MSWFLLFGIFISYTYADSFQIAGQYLEFLERDGLHLHGCEKECSALKIINTHKKIPLNKLRSGQHYSNSDGSDVCALAYKARSVIGLASNQDQRAFCLFSDGSMVEMNSLTQYLRQKKYLKQ